MRSVDIINVMLMLCIISMESSPSHGQSNKNWHYNPEWCRDNNDNPIESHRRESRSVARPGSPGISGGAGLPGSPGGPMMRGSPGSSGGPGSPGSPGGAGGPGGPGGPGGAGGPGANGFPGGAGGPGGYGGNGGAGCPGGAGGQGGLGGPGGPAGPRSVRGPDGARGIDGTRGPDDCPGSPGGPGGHRGPEIPINRKKRNDRRPSGYELMGKMKSVCICHFKEVFKCVSRKLKETNGKMECPADKACNTCLEELITGCIPSGFNCPGTKTDQCTGGHEIYMDEIMQMVQTTMYSRDS